VGPSVSSTLDALPHDETLVNKAAIIAELMHAAMDVDAPADDE
jgi:hypothetical protein